VVKLKSIRMDYLMRRKEKIEDGKGYKEEVKKE
jgi:hypothetical protein